MEYNHKNSVIYTCYYQLELKHGRPDQFNDNGIIIEERTSKNGLKRGKFYRLQHTSRYRERRYDGLRYGETHQYNAKQRIISRAKYNNAYKIEKRVILIPSIRSLR